MLSLFLKLVNMSISAGWLVLVVLVLRLALRRSPKWVICLLWGVVAFRFACPISIESRWSLMPRTDVVGMAYLEGLDGTGKDADRVGTDNGMFDDDGISAIKPDGISPSSWLDGAGKNKAPLSISGKTETDGVSLSNRLDGTEKNMALPNGLDSLEAGAAGNPDVSDKVKAASDTAAVPNQPDNVGESRKNAADKGGSEQLKKLFLQLAAYSWGIVMAVMLAMAVLSYVGLRRKLREAVQLEDNIWMCDNIRSPFILGMFRPRIYLASGMEQEKKQLVLAHERAHLRRCDHLWKPIGFILLSVYWFQPLAWAAFYYFCKDMEIACDEAVIRDLSVEKKKEYCKALLDCAAPKRMLYACPLAFGEVGIKERIKSIFRYKKPGFWAIVASLTVCVIVGVCFLTNPVGRVTANSSRQDGAGNTEVQAGDKTVGNPGLETPQGIGTDSNSGSEIPQGIGTDSNSGSEILQAAGTDKAIATETPQTSGTDGVGTSSDADANVSWDSGKPKKYALGDVNGSGQEDYIIVTNPQEDPYPGILEFYLDGEMIYRYQDELPIVSVEQEAGYLDLDGDGQEEIFFTMQPLVNSMPLEEYAVLKNTRTGWKPLEIIHGESMLDNGFPISVTQGQNMEEVIIACDGLEKEVVCDLKRHCEEIKAGRDDGGQELIKQYETYFTHTNDRSWAWERTGFGVSAWGVHHIAAGRYDGKNCLIAEHGIDGITGKADCLGNLDVYFDFDAAGRTRILDMVFYPWWETSRNVTEGEGEEAYQGTTVPEREPHYGIVDEEEKIYRGTTPGEAYAGIADVYYRADQCMEHATDIEEAMAAVGNAYVNGEFLAMNREMCVPEYLMYDLNGDGTDEFFIGLGVDYGNGEVHHTIFDAYTWKDGQAYQLMRDIGYRNGTCEIYEGGVIFDHHSGSASDWDIYFCRLPEGATELERFDCISSRTEEVNTGNHHGHGESHHGEHDQAGGTRQVICHGDHGAISQSECEKIMGQYCPANLGFVECTPNSIKKLR